MSESDDNKPKTVREMIEKKRAAGGPDPIADDPEAVATFDALAANRGITSLAAAAKAGELVNAPVNHHTREPNQPSEATIVEGSFDPDSDNDYSVKLVRKSPGNVEFQLRIHGCIFGQLPFDNLVKAATRIDPDHAVGTEKQIQKLRREAAEAKAEMYDWQAKALQLEEKLRAFQEASKA